MRKSGVLWAGLAVLLSQGAALAVAGDLKAGIELAWSDGRYGCCMVKTTDKTGDVWEYEDAISFGVCYKWARLKGLPLQGLNNRKYEFYENKRCDALGSEHELIPALWSPSYRSG